MRLTAILAVVMAGSFVTAAQADIRVPPKKEPVRITSQVTIKHGAIKGVDRNVVAKIVIPAGLVHAEAPRAGAAPTRNAPRSEEQGALRGSTGTWVAGIALSLAAVSLVFVVRGRRMTRTIAATILGGSALLGTYGAVYANAPAPPPRPERAPAAQIVIELVEDGDTVTLLLAE